eukprot:4537044-Amphidinium_carterae.1
MPSVSVGSSIAILAQDLLVLGIVTAAVSLEWGCPQCEQLVEDCIVMAWGPDQSSRLMGELLGLLVKGQTGAWEKRNKPQRQERSKPKRGNFGDGWNCSS